MQKLGYNPVFDLTTTAKSGHATKLKVDGKFFSATSAQKLLLQPKPQVISHGLKLLLLQNIMACKVNSLAPTRSFKIDDFAPFWAKGVQIANSKDRLRRWLISSSS